MTVTVSIDHKGEKICAIEVEVNNACVNLDYYKAVRINTKIMNKEELQNLFIKIVKDCRKTNYRGY